MKRKIGCFPKSLLGRELLWSVTAGSFEWKKQHFVVVVVAWSHWDLEVKFCTYPRLSWHSREGTLRVKIIYLLCLWSFFKGVDNVIKEIWWHMSSAKTSTLLCISKLLLQNLSLRNFYHTDSLVANNITIGIFKSKLDIHWKLPQMLWSSVAWGDLDAYQTLARLFPEFLHFSWGN